MPMPMSKWSSPLALAGALAALLVALPAAADVYAWRTEDGVFAYTDDPARIPARYAAVAVRVEDTRLENYARLTRPDPEATQAVAAGLEQRLQYLRRLNGLEAQPASSRGEAESGRATLSVATHDERAPRLDVTVDERSGPVVVEPVITKRDGRVATRRTTVVRQGDRTLALIKGRSRHTNPTQDIVRERDLLD